MKERPSPPDLVAVARAIARRAPSIAPMLRATPALACAALPAGATRSEATAWFFAEIGHHLYAGDTLLHVAAAAYDRAVAKLLVAAGADVRAKNRRGAEPLHYAADGSPTSATWDPEAQAKTVAYLLAMGADPDALDKSGVAPLHRAVRTRSTGAVRALLVGGANPRLANKSGSTPRDLAGRTTGRGGSGEPEAKREQAAILRLLDAHGG